MFSGVPKIFLSTAEGSATSGGGRCSNRKEDPLAARGGDTREAVEVLVLRSREVDDRVAADTPRPARCGRFRWELLRGEGEYGLEGVSAPLGVVEPVVSRSSHMSIDLVQADSFQGDIVHEKHR
jgi:hypothetical protein